VQFPRDIYNRVRAEGAAAERTPSYIVRKAVKEFIDRLDNADALKAAG
jgi:predicted transcriptional regulator